MSTVLEKYSQAINELAAAYSLEIEEAEIGACFGNSSVVLSGGALSFKALLVRSEEFLVYQFESVDWIDVRVALAGLGKLGRTAMPGLDQLIKAVAENREAFLRMIGCS
jgi:hypothetical protein